MAGLQKNIRTSSCHSPGVGFPHARPSLADSGSCPAETKSSYPHRSPVPSLHGVHCPQLSCL